MCGSPHVSQKRTMRPFYVGRAGPELPMQQKSAVHVRPIVLSLLLLACATRFCPFSTQPNYLNTIAEHPMHDISHQPKSSALFRASYPALCASSFELCVSYADGHFPRGFTNVHSICEWLMMNDRLGRSVVGQGMQTVIELEGQLVLFLVCILDGLFVPMRFLLITCSHNNQPTRGANRHSPGAAFQQMPRTRCPSIRTRSDHLVTSPCPATIRWPLVSC